MRTRAKGTSRAAVLAAGFVALGVTVLPSHAFADVTSGDGGILSGNQIDAPVSAPVDVSGNNVAVAGIGDATSHGGAKVHKRHADGQRTSGAHGIASGNQVNAPVSAPVNVCGNSAAVVGTADSGCKGGAKVNGGGAHGGQTTDGSGGVLAGNQLNAPISAPVNLCGNAAAVAGIASAHCQDGNGGYPGYSSSPRPLDLLPRTGSHPVLPRVADDLPSVTDLPGRTNVPSSYSRAQSGTPSPATLLDMAGTPSANNLLQPRELPQTLGRPAADGQRTKNGLPGTEGLLGAIGLTQVNDLVVPVGVGQRAQGGVSGAEGLLGAIGLTQVNGLVLPAAGQRVQGGVPGAEGLPGVNGLAQVNDLVVPVAAGHRTQGGLPGTDGVPVGGELTEAGDLVQAGGLPGVSVVGARRAGVPVADGLLPVDAPLGTLGRPGLSGGLPSMGFSKLVKPQGERAEAVRPGLLDVVLRQDPLAAVTGLVTVNPPVPLAGVGGGAVQQRAGAGQEGPVAVSVLDTRALQDGTGELGAVRNVAADGPIIEDGAGSLWALGASAVLGAVAGVLALARRMLPGGRR
ncbi:chaplin family protein [Actinomadura geliboluensis]|uniref:chaplin family protein n=1 Tax=Actinomadura geliboluensis TaxID=882440 RepID=UPI00371F7314